jgi:hypothetical protein
MAKWRHGVINSEISGVNRRRETASAKRGIISVAIKSNNGRRQRVGIARHHARRGIGENGMARVTRGA